MNTRIHLKYKQSGIYIFMGLTLSACILFLQVGFTYYWSFQILALLLLMIVILKNRPLLVNLAPILLSTAIFATFLLLVTLNAPLAISQDTDVFTFIGVIGYAIMIISAPNIAFRSPVNILLFFRFVSAATLISIASLICIADLSIIPFFNREILIYQNITLIDNFTTLDVLAKDFFMRDTLGLEPDMDLFYGEQSFLAVVIFACVTSNIISDKLLRAISPPMHELGREALQDKSFADANFNLQSFLLVVALATMLYIKSFSTFFYVLVICISIFLGASNRRFYINFTIGKVLIFSLAVILLGGIIVQSVFDYYSHRLSTLSDSISFEQRFASIFDFGFQEYIFGIIDTAKIPQYGFHNGILYIIGISGLGGIGLIIFLYYRIYLLARPFRLSFLAIMCAFGIFSQNGGVFSPSKIVLLWLVLIPLSCVNRFRLPKHTIEVEVEQKNGNGY